MWRTHILLSIATLSIGVLCSDNVNYESYAASSSSSSSSSFSSQYDTRSEDTYDCNGPNEYYEDCSSASDDADDYCQTGCQCEDDYARDGEGNCLPVDETSTDVTTPDETCITSSSPADSDPNVALDNIWKGNAAFTQKFLELKTNEDPNKSFIASPFSVLVPLGQLDLFANGRTYDQVTRVLSIDNKDQIRQGFRQLLDNFKSPKNVTLLLGQKIYGNIQFEFTNDFECETKVYFDAKAQNLDFSQSKKAANEINEWVKEQTNGLIPNLVDPSLLNAQTRLVLVNAIYFKGDWLRSFNPKDTQKKDFYITQNKKSTVNMMYQKGRFRYGENLELGIKALELLYQDSDYSFLCLLPTSTKTYSLQGVAHKLQDPKTFGSIIDNLRYEEVRVYLPSIETSTTTDLTKVFQAVNITDILNPQRSNLSGILKKFEPLYISAAIQKAVVIINELGSQAAASNAVVVTALSASINGPKIFEANRPYFYFIMYKKNIIFCGSYKGNRK